MSNPIRAAAAVIRNSKGCLALTGAGISVESGIPDFRSRGGLWERFDPSEYATIDAFRRDPAKVWRMLAEMNALLSGAEPNEAHRALASMERERLLSGIVTQNIDGLHQRAGSVNVVEFHGSHRSLSCTGCGDGYTVDDVETMEMPPLCCCGGPIKPDVILFGEMIPSGAIRDSEILLSQCDVMLVIGTSAEVVPASQLPVRMKHNGGIVIEINIETTGLTGSITDIFLRGNCTTALEELNGELSI